MSILIKHEGPVATVTLNRPAVHNALNEAMLRELIDTFGALAADPGCRVVVLEGAGASFSAGADLEWMRRAATLSPEENIADARLLDAAFTAIATCPKPVVACARGYAFGGALGLLVCADIAICHAVTRLGFTEVRLGIVPATIAPHVIRRIGAGRARALFLTGERFDAAGAYRLGLIDFLAPDDADFLAIRDRVVGALLAGGPEAQAAIKAFARDLADLSAEQARERAVELIAARRASAEGREGIAAFLEKRRATWRADAGN